ncbi:hypothetical protein CsatB_011274 [Cannabis sativa]
MPRREKRCGHKVDLGKLREGDWKELEFKEYNFTAKGLLIDGGHFHPFLKARIKFSILLQCILNFGNTGEFMVSRYREIAEIVLRYLEHRDHLVRQSITSLLPRIAHFLRDRFVANYLTVFLIHSCIMNLGKYMY